MQMSWAQNVDELGSSRDKSTAKEHDEISYSFQSRKRKQTDCMGTCTTVSPRHKIVS